VDSDSYFNLDEKLVYVNHAAVTPWPVRTVEAVNAFAGENGMLGSRHYSQWINTETLLRQQLAELIHAKSADEIALLKNTSEALSVVAYGLEWHAGDNIVISDEEFPSNRIVWESLKPQGVEIRYASLKGADPEQALIDLIDDKTRLLSISSVQYASGIRIKLEPLGAYCKQHDVLFCVDAIQHIGALEFDVQAINADFVMADGHKWMLGPEGLALFYCRQDLIGTLKLNQFGWHMVENHMNFDTKYWKPAHSARRFECGSPNMMAAHALSASVSVLLEVGMDKIQQSVLDKVQYLIKIFSAEKDIEMLSPTDKDRHGGIFTFCKKGVKNEDLYAFLVEKGAVCALRGGGIRFSPHFYTPNHKLDTLLDWVTEFSA
jgi:selenocysteine lyase/cysteine desulfurase